MLKLRESIASACINWLLIACPYQTSCTIQKGYKKGMGTLKGSQLYKAGSQLYKVGLPPFCREVYSKREEFDAPHPLLPPPPQL